MCVRPACFRPKDAEMTQAVLAAKSAPPVTRPARAAALPAAIFSGVMFLICLGLYAFVDRVDSEVRGSGNGR